MSLWVLIKLEVKLKNTSKDKRPSILIVVHLGGLSCDMKKIRKLSEKYKFKVIEDASHAIGAKYEKTLVGSCKYSDLTVFSFHPVKIITTGEGGAITSKSKNVYDPQDILDNKVNPTVIAKWEKGLDEHGQETEKYFIKM